MSPKKYSLKIPRNGRLRGRHKGCTLLRRRAENSVSYRYSERSLLHSLLGFLLDSFPNSFRSNENEKLNVYRTDC